MIMNEKTIFFCGIVINIFSFLAFFYSSTGLFLEKSLLFVYFSVLS